MKKRAHVIAAARCSGASPPPPRATAAAGWAPGDSARMLATLIGNVDGAVFRCRHDAQWTMELISAGCERLTCDTPQQLIGNRELSFHDLIHRGDQGPQWRSDPAVGHMIEH